MLIIGTISEKRELVDKYGRAYLQIRTEDDGENPNVFFVFHSNIRLENWADLRVGQKYILTVRKNPVEYWELLSFEKMLDS